MFTSATDKTAFACLTATALTALFGGVYEVFSHGVWSAWMVYAFAFPLALDALPFGWLALRRRPLPRRWVCRLHHSGVAALTVGSIMEGVFAIYGTTSRLTVVYWIVGGALLVLAQTVRLLACHSQHKTPC